MRQDVVSDPGLGGGEFCEGRYVAVADRDGDGDVCVGEGAEEFGVGVEELDAVYGGLGFEEIGYLLRWREVVGDGAVVDADGVSGGGGDGVARQGEEEEEEELREFSNSSSHDLRSEGDSERGELCVRFMLLCERVVGTRFCWTVVGAIGDSLIE